jgi:hypothetical protein
MGRKLEPFHPVQKKVGGRHSSYDIYAFDGRDDHPYLQSNPRFPLSRPAAYAIARLLNEETRQRKWGPKFPDYYGD